jgi:hypothetical protein
MLSMQPCHPVLQERRIDYHRPNSRGNRQTEAAIDFNTAIIGGQHVGISYFVFAWLVERSKARATVHI